MFVEKGPCYREYCAHSKELTNDRATKIYKKKSYVIKLVKSNGLGCLRTVRIWRQCRRVAWRLAW